MLLTHLDLQHLLRIPIMSKLYLSEAWLRREYLIKKKKPLQIAKEQGITEVTVYVYLRKFGLIK